MKGSAEGRKAKVVHVITRFDKGGSAENTFLTLTGLDRDKYELSLIYGVASDMTTPPNEARSIEENLNCLRKKNIRLIQLPKLVRPISPGKDASAFISLYFYFSQLKPLIVHTHTSKAGILGRWAAYFARVPIICHTPHGHVFWGYFGPLQTRLFILLEKMTAWITHRLIMLTAQERDDHLLYRIAPKDKFVVIHSGVDLEPFLNTGEEIKKQMRAALSIGEEDFVIGTAGRLTSIKGQRYLLSAFSLYLQRGGQGLCILLGDGELRSELENQAKTLGISERVRFLGWRSDVAAVMSTFDIFVLPSLNEGMGKVIVEAMACSLPVIASDIGGIRDLVEPGINGLLVPAACEENLAHALMILYKQENKRVEMGRRGKEKALLYSKGAMVEKIDHLYETLLSSPKRKKLNFP